MKVGAFSVPMQLFLNDLMHTSTLLENSQLPRTESADIKSSTQLIATTSRSFGGEQAAPFMYQGT